MSPAGPPVFVHCNLCLLAFLTAAFSLLSLGEFLTRSEARKRQIQYDRAAEKASATSSSFASYLMTVREVLPSGVVLRTHIDPTFVGSLGRFMSHSCDGGNVRRCIVRRSGSLLPLVALVTSRSINIGEELSFQYGDTSEVDDVGYAHLKTRRPCFCGKRECAGFLPYEDVL